MRIKECAVAYLSDTLGYNDITLTGSSIYQYTVYYRHTVLTYAVYPLCSIKRGITKLFRTAFYIYIFQFTAHSKCIFTYLRKGFGQYNTCDLRVMVKRSVTYLLNALRHHYLTDTTAAIYQHIAEYHHRVLLFPVLQPLCSIKHTITYMRYARM